MKSLSSFLESPIVEVHFQGFRSSTPQLQSSGWAISARELAPIDHSPFDRSVQLMMEHDCGVRLISNLQLVHRIGFGHSAYIDGRRFGAPVDQPRFDIIGMEFSGSSRFVIPMVRPEDVEFTYGMRKGERFMPIDARPAVQQLDLGSVNLSQWGIFKKLDHTTNIYLPEKTCTDLLEEILKKQAPRQKEIRKNERVREFTAEFNRKPEETIKAQLIAI